MPLGPGGLDSNGIWIYGEDDSEALASDLLNLGMQSVSDALAGGPGILQVVSTTKTDAFTVGSNTYNDVTGLTVSITPTSATSKILVLAATYVGNDTNDGPWVRVRIVRDSTSIGSNATHDASMAMSSVSGGARNIFGGAFVFLDSPNSTSATTYKVQAARENGFTGYINRSGTGTATGSSHITVMEVAA
jgi:hypothetical protein